MTDLPFEPVPADPTAPAPDNAAGPAAGSPGAGAPPMPAAGYEAPSMPAAGYEPPPMPPVGYEAPREPVRRPRSRSAMWINVALCVALAVALGGVAFAAGRMTAPASAVSADRGLGNGAFPGGYFPRNGYFPGAGQGRGIAGVGTASIQGQVTAVTPTSITITTAGGQTVTVTLNTGTTYHRESSAAASDVTAGGTVIVRLGFRGAGSAEAGSGPAATDVTIVPTQ